MKFPPGRTRLMTLLETEFHGQYLSPLTKHLWLMYIIRCCFTESQFLLPTSQRLKQRETNSTDDSRWHWITRCRLTKYGVCGDSSEGESDEGRALCWSPLVMFRRPCSFQYIESGGEKSTRIHINAPDFTKHTNTHTHTHTHTHTGDTLDNSKYFHETDLK